MNTKALVTMTASIIAANAVLAADWTVSENTVLSADMTVDTLTVNAGVTLDLNGYKLTCSALAGSGTITRTGENDDLTSPQGRVTGTYLVNGVDTSLTGGSYAALFDDDFTIYGNPHRLLSGSLANGNFLTVMYDFGEDAEAVVNKFKIYNGPNGSSRNPFVWKFEGSNDKESGWITLQSVGSYTPKESGAWSYTGSVLEAWKTTDEKISVEYSFDNTTAYRYYRFVFIKTNASYCELKQLEFFNTNPGELHVNVPAGAFVTNSTVSIGGNIRLVKQGEGVFVAAKANQTYSGGNHVAAGTIKPIPQNVDLLFGANGSDIKVDSDAAFDINGNTRCSLYHYVMMDGSTFDLKAWNGVFNTASTSTHQSGFKLIYDEGATVTIDIAGRTPTVGECLISWDEMPTGVTFQFDAATAEGGVPPIATERGLFYGYIDNVAEWAWWTGAESVGDLFNPQNWLCKNAGGGVIENGLPSSSTRVYLPASLDVQIPENTAFACGVCILSNATLSADCDLRGLGTNLQVAANAVIDLNGHKLYARAAAFTGVCTVKGKAIDHADDLTTTDASCVTSLPFNDGNTPASNLFNNNYARGDNTKRVLVPKADWPLVVTYDFGEGKVVDAYRMWTGPIGDFVKRMPRRWKFEGSNDGATWTLLDRRSGEAVWPADNIHRTYSFSNTTAYSRYRITIEENNGADNYGSFIELVQLEYFNLKPTQGELHLSTVSGESTQLYNMSLAGNLRFFIEGEGLLFLGTEGQTYIGGTEICGGMVSGGPANTSLLNKDIFGVKGSEVVIHGDNTGTASATSGLLGFVGRYGYTGYKYVLDGGNIRDPGDGIVTELLLTTNSYMEASSSLPAYGTAWFGWGGDEHAAYADLGGHELSVKIAGTKTFSFANVTLENGIVYTGTQNGTFTVTNSVVATNNVLFRLNSNASNIAGTFSVRDYTQIRSFKDYNLGSYDVDVLGTFTPSAQGFFHGTTLHDGSTIDLSELGIATLNVVAPYSASSTAPGAKTLHFVQGATIGVKLGGRRVPRNTPVISWTAATKPDASVKFVARDEGRRLTFIKKEDGLYVLSGLMLIVR